MKLWLFDVFVVFVFLWLVVEDSSFEFVMLFAVSLSY